MMSDVVSKNMWVFNADGGMGTDWCWCYENPKEAAARIDSLLKRVAELEREIALDKECCTGGCSTATSDATKEMK